MNRTAAADMSYWWPLVMRSGVQVPQTRIVTAPAEIDLLLDGKTPLGFERFIHLLKCAAVEVGGYPVFLRTGQTSGKHSWTETCYITSEAAFPRHVAELVEFSAMVDFMGLPTCTWVVREFLADTDAPFKAFSGMPVARERRYFAEAGKVLCQHPYWPAESLECCDGLAAAEQSTRGYTDNPDWRALLAVLNEDTPEAIAELTTLSERVSLLLPGAWSLDWLWTRRGWYLTDAAPAELSWHWHGCPVSLQRKWET